MAEVMNNLDAAVGNLHPLEAARFLRAFVECNREMQETVLEMAEIVSDPTSTDDERALAFDAMMEALFPGTSAHVLDFDRQRLKSPEAASEAEKLKEESRSFGQRVKEAMVKNGVTQSQLAAAAGIGQPAVSNILNRGCHPQRRTIERFANALQMSPDDLWPGFSETVTADS
jgi:lambda repressor-like predicted transcriptional regulator